MRSNSLERLQHLVCLSRTVPISTTVLRPNDLASFRQSSVHISSSVNHRSAIYSSYFCLREVPLMGVSGGVPQGGGGTALGRSPLNPA